MSIDAILERLEKEGRLVKYLPPGNQMGRHLWLTRAVNQAINDARSAPEFFGQTRWIVTAFDRWVSGEEMGIRLKGRAAAADLALLAPPPEGIWEFRIVQPRPQLRIFARFAAKDVIVAMACHNRDYLGSASGRGAKRSRTWLEAMYECEAEWTRIFGGTRPIRGAGVEDYVTQNARECA